MDLEKEIHEYHTKEYIALHPLFNEFADEYNTGG